MKGVILLSGGLDSAVMFYYAQKRGYNLTALIFDYKQRHKKEIQCAIKIAELNKVKYYVEKIDLIWTKSSLTDKRKNVPCNRDVSSGQIPSTYVAGRNIIFLSYAFSLAESIGAKRVFIGAHIQDYSGYPDCRPQFLYNFEQAVNLGIEKSDIRITAPLIDNSKKEIIKLGVKLGVPFQWTWSCYQGGRRPCGKCDSCRFRLRAFKELAIDDSGHKKRRGGPCARPLLAT